MKILGERIGAKDANGKLLSRIGTLFLKTPGLVTRRGVHAMQRMMWIDELNAARAAEGRAPLTPPEEEEELAASVDLIFTEENVLIRPDPGHLDLAFRADEELQKLVSKRIIRYLNTSSSKVRMALTARGENWRMARQPISQEDMVALIDDACVAIDEKPVYYYNPATGTRFITASRYAEVAKLPDDEYRRQVAEVVRGLNKRNRLGFPEVDLFPLVTPIEIKSALRQLELEKLNDAELRRALDRLDAEWRMSLPAELRDETTANYDWRNTMCDVLTRQPNETNAEEQEILSGIAPEFYRQIEWLPGARIDRGEVIFDRIYEEANRTQDPKLLELCDMRVKSIIFNLTRLFGSVDFINVGRIARSLMREPISGTRRGSVYIIQYRETGAEEVKMMLIRFQKWGVAEHLDEGKDLLHAIIEADEYTDYVLDRRLMCRQLGMNLPQRIGLGHFTERYHGANTQYNGAAVRTSYFVRPYVGGIASDKIPLAKYRNPAFALSFARLMGGAAALDLVVGRRSSETKELLFDKNYEVFQVSENGLPVSLTITDHAGSFVNYEHYFEDYVAQYATAVIRRREFVTDYAGFVEEYVRGFVAKLEETQAAYRARKTAFDNLFVDRPFDTNGSGAYRWARTLARLDQCDPVHLGKLLRQACAC